jgi:sugar (pentulose or hexulose) kinase
MLLAAAATGTAGHIEEAARSINPIAATIAPDPGVARRYRELFARYNRLYEALRPAFDHLA